VYKEKQHDQKETKITRQTKRDKKTFTKKLQLQDDQKRQQYLQSQSIKKRQQEDRSSSDRSFHIKA